MGLGWFLFHLHHLHVSLNPGLGVSATRDPRLCLTPDCDQIGPRWKLVPGHALVETPMVIDLSW